MNPNTETLLSGTVWPIRLCALTSILLVLGLSGVAGSGTICVHPEEGPLRLTCDGADTLAIDWAILASCKRGTNCCQVTNSIVDVITAGVRGRCEGRAECHVAVDSWYPAEDTGGTSLKLKYSCVEPLKNIKRSLNHAQRAVHATPRDAETGSDPRPVILATGAPEARATDWPTYGETATVTECYGSYFTDQICFDDTTIEITDAIYGQSPCNLDPTNCCPGPGDCTISIQTESPDYYDQILKACNDKQACDNLLAQWNAFVSMWCVNGTGTTDYVTLHYTCLTAAERTTEMPTVPPTTVQPSTVPLTTMDPSSGPTGRNPGDTSHSSSTPDVRTTEAGIVTTTRGYPTGGETATVTECYASYFDDQLCFDDTTIEITNATYGQSPCSANLTNCCPESSGDCTIPIQTATPGYYNETLVKCNRRQTCDNLVANWYAHVNLWCVSGTGTTDYVTLYYTCLTEAERTTEGPTVLPTTAPPATAPPSTIPTSATVGLISMATQTLRTPDATSPVSSHSGPTDKTSTATAATTPGRLTAGETTNPATLRTQPSTPSDPGDGTTRPDSGSSDPETTAGITRGTTRGWPIAGQTAAVTQCYAGYFDDQLCFEDTTIEITNATYGQSQCYLDPTNCCSGSPDDCTIPIPTASPDYYNETLVRCNGRQACDRLIAQWYAYVNLWCVNGTGTTDYVTLHYTCLTAAQRTTEAFTVPPSTVPPSTVPPSTVPPSTVPPSTGLPSTTLSSTSVGLTSGAVSRTSDSPTAGNTTNGDTSPTSQPYLTTSEPGDQKDETMSTTLFIVIVSVSAVGALGLVVGLSLCLVDRKSKKDPERRTAEKEDGLGEKAAGVASGKQPRQTSQRSRQSNLYTPQPVSGQTSGAATRQDPQPDYDDFELQPDYDFEPEADYEDIDNRLSPRRVNEKDAWSDSHGQSHGYADINPIYSQVGRRQNYDYNFPIPEADY